LRDSKNDNINNIRIIHNYRFSKLAPPRTFFSFNSPNINVEFKTKLSLTSNIGIKLGNGCEILSDIDSEKFHYLYGRYSKFGLCNESGDVQAIFDYGDSLVNSYIIFYKVRNSFYLIVVNSLGNGTINDEALKLLKLE
jgi:hypothetical protein